MGFNLVSRSTSLSAVRGDGLQLIVSSVFTTAASVNVDGYFTSQYENYLAIIPISATSTNQNVTFHFRASGADDTTAVYDYGIMRASSAGGGSTGIAFSGQAATSATIMELTSASFMENSLTMTFIRPRAANMKNVIVHGIGGPYGVGNASGLTGGISYRGTTAFDGFGLTVGGTMSGRVYLYGYRTS